MTQRIVLMTAALLAGILIGLGQELGAGIVLIWLALKSPRQQLPFLTFALITGMIIGWQDTRSWDQPPEPSGAVEALPADFSIKKERLIFSGKAANGVPVSGSSQLTSEQVHQLQHTVQPVQLRLDGAYTRVPGPRNLFEFDQAAYQWAQFRRAYRISAKRVQVTILPISTPKAWLSRIQVWLVMRFEQLPPKTQRYAKGFLLGQVDEDFASQRQTFVSLGIFHIFSVSGLHLVTMIGFFYWGANRLRLPRGAMDSWLLVFLPSLLLILPLGAGLLRAVWMRVLAILNHYLGFSLSPLAIFALVLSGNLMIQPRVLLTMGGQLTYLLTAVLVLLPDESHWQLNWRMLVISAPVVIFHTFQFNLLSFLFNGLLVPVFEVVVIPALIFVVIFPIPVLLNVMEAGLSGLESFLTSLAHLPGQITLGAMTALLCLIGLGIALKLIAQRYRTWPWVACLLGWGILAWGLNWFQPEARVTIIDVGQGDAILIEAPFRRHAMLIDTGGRLFGDGPIPVTKSILPYLRGRGWDHIDTLVLTHPDRDHVGDAALLTQQFSVKQLVTTANAAKDPLIVSASRGVQRTVIVGAGDQLQVASLSFDVFAPAKDRRGTEHNADSIVLYGKIGSHTWLFTGDADKAVEKTMLLPKGRHVDFLKVSHHGSKTASDPEFIASLTLRAGFISAGVNNRYGHPHPETLATFEKLGIPLYQTPTSGMITIQHGAIYSYLAPKKE